MTDLRDKVQVEAPSEARWERLERKLFEARDRELRESGVDALPGGVGPGGARAARQGTAAAAIYGARKLSSRRMLIASGVSFSLAAAAAVLVFFFVRRVGSFAVGGGEAAPVRIITPAGGTSRVELGEAVVEIGGDTAIEARVGAGGAVTIDLMRGRVGCDVTPRPGRAPFAVLAGDVTVSVVGTAFSVERGDTVTVHVTRGRVAVRSGAAEPIALVAGDGWSSTTGRMASAAPAGATVAEATAGAGGAGGAGSAGAGARRGAGSEGAGGRGAGAAGGAGGAGAAGGAGGGSNGGARADGEIVIEEGPAAGVAARSGARTGTGTAAGAAKGYQGTLEEAAKLESKDEAKAIEMYRKLSAGKDAVAERATVRLAGLLSGRKKDADKVIELAQRYERRFPHGAHLVDMLYLEISAHIRKGDMNSAHRVARRFLENKGDPKRLEELKIIE